MDCGVQPSPRCTERSGRDLAHQEDLSFMRTAGSAGDVGGVAEQEGADRRNSPGASAGSGDARLLFLGLRRNGSDQPAQANGRRSWAHVEAVHVSAIDFDSRRCRAAAPLAANLQTRPEVRWRTNRACSRNSRAAAPHRTNPSDLPCVDSKRFRSCGGRSCRAGCRRVHDAVRGCRGISRHLDNAAGRPAPPPSRN